MSYFELSLLTCVQKLRCLLVYFQFFWGFPPNRCVDNVTDPSHVGDNRVCRAACITVVKAGSIKVINEDYNLFLKLGVVTPLSTEDVVSE